MNRSPRIVGFAIPCLFFGCQIGGGGSASDSLQPTVSTNPTTVSASEVTAGSETGGGSEGTTTAVPGGVDAVDILIVIDDSGSMAEEQAMLSASIGALVDPLEAASIRYRIGITTTDVGNPRCLAASTSPTRGELQRRSCIDRVGEGEFTFAGVDPPLDGSATCTDYCEFADGDIEVLPTATDVDPNPKGRPWIEGGAGASNIAGISVVKALQCYLPQGIAGCGFESPLEAMRRALVQAQSDTEGNYGFLRDDAALLVIIVSDETDCSVAAGEEDIFVSNKVFWNDPGDPVPTSAVCWRAGVTCEGSKAGFDSCYPQDHSSGGGTTDLPSQAVLYPISRYVDLLEELAAAKAGAVGPGAVQLRLIAGVPAGYVEGAAIPYAATDASSVADFGVDPACASATGAAIPSVRELAVSEALSGGVRTAYSVCAGDYSGALAAAAASIVALGE